VVPLSREYLPQGWVAGASRAGEPWIEDGDFICPPTPTDVRSLTAVPQGVGLACFPKKPITLRARLFECNCDIDGGYFDPDWFTFSSRSPLLVGPEATSPPADVDDWFPVYLDPTGQYPAALPIGTYTGEGTLWSQPEIAVVTGIFDHPAAASCTLTAMDGDPTPTNLCRLKFAVTDLAVIPR